MRFCPKNAPKMLEIRENAPNFSKMRQNFFNFLKMRQKLPLYFGNVSKSVAKWTTFFEKTSKIFLKCVWAAKLEFMFLITPLSHNLTHSITIFCLQFSNF